MEKGIRKVEVVLFSCLLLIIILSLLPLFNINISNQVYDFIYILAEIVGLLMALIYIFRIDRSQKLWLGWLFILSALISYLLGDFLIFLKEESLAEILKILSFIFNIIGLLVFIIFIGNSLRLRLTFNENFLLVINSILLFVLILQVGLLPVILNSSHSPWDKAINIMYLLGNYILLVLFMILFLTITTHFWGGEIARNYYLLTLGISLLSISNLIFSYVLGGYEVFNLDKIIYLGAYLVIAYSIVKEGALHLS